MTARLQYAVFGQPIAHSLSPRIHAMFADQFGIALEYRAVEAGRDAFPRALDAFAQNDGRGANVTLPLKQDALRLCREVGDLAARSNSVNTLIRTVDGWRGETSDGAGLLRDLRERHAFDPAGRRCLMIGAGGAARAVAFAICDAGVTELAIANRTHDRAVALAHDVNATHVHAVATTDLAAINAFDLIINATAAGHHAASFDVPRAIVASGTLCYDLSYGRVAASFLQWARAAGATRASDGLGMLVEQAADAFALWHGKRPDTAPVFEALRRDVPQAPGIAR